MREVSEIEVLDNFDFWRRANIISQIEKEVTLNYIANKLDDSITNSYLRGLLKFLEDAGFLEIDRSNIKYLYKIKCEKLSWFLIKGEIGKHIYINFHNRMRGIKMGYLGY